MNYLRAISMALGVLVLAQMQGVGWAEPAADADGLVPVKIAGLDSVRVRSGADLSHYNAVLLDPIEVSFRKDWERTSAAGWPVTPKESLDIRQRLAKVLREEFIRTLERDGKYAVATAPADNVLRIKAEIRNLYLNAPDLPRAGIRRSYTLSVGEMTLSAELRDSVTGALIARVHDREEDPESAWLELTTSVDNDAAARRAAQKWSRILLKELNLAHSQIRGRPQ